MRNRTLCLIIAGTLALIGCSKGPSTAAGQTATVMLKDGGNFSGTVTKSDTSAITLQAANGETRTYPMSQVESVQYTDSTTATAAAPSAQAPANSPYPAPVPDNSQSPLGPAPGAPSEPMRTIPAGTTLRVRNSDTIRAGVAEAGQKFPGVVTQDVIGADGGVAIPKGSDAMLIVRSSTSQGKMEGQSEIAIDVDSVTVGGRHYNLETVDIVEKGKQGLGKNKRSAEFVGGGALFGTIVGAVAGGGKGAAIGAAAGGGAGAGVQAMTRGKAVSIPAETILSFRLEEAVKIRPSR
jgi:hypothetical protein